MPCRVALLSSVLGVILAACAPPDPPAVNPVVAVSPTPPTQAVANEPAPANDPAPAVKTRPSTEGWKSFEDGDLVGFKDAQGKVVLAPRYQIVQEFTPGGMACVVEGDGWVCIDGNGTPLLRPFVYDNAPDEFSEGLARFVEADKIGFFDNSGHKQIPARFSFAMSFNAQRAAFCDGCTKQCEGEYCSMSGGKWGLIDPIGTEIAAATFDEINAFEDGIAHAIRGDKALTINRDGVPQTPKVKKRE